MQRRMLTHLFVIATSLIAHQPACAAAVIPRLSDDAVIVAFGDSLTYGIGSSGESYPSELQRIIRRQVVNAGDPGATLADGRARIDGMLRVRQPALIIICLGLNDFLQGRPEPAIRSDLTSVLDATIRFKVPAILVAVARPGESAADPLFEELATAHGVMLLTDVLPALSRSPLMKSDLVHLNEAGYRSLGKTIARYLRSIGAV